MLTILFCVSPSFFNTGGSAPQPPSIFPLFSLLPPSLPPSYPYSLYFNQHTVVMGIVPVHYLYLFVFPNQPVPPRHTYTDTHLSPTFSSSFSPPFRIRYRKPVYCDKQLNSVKHYHNIFLLCLVFFYYNVTCRHI